MNPYIYDEQIAVSPLELDLSWYDSSSFGELPPESILIGLNSILNHPNVNDISIRGFPALSYYLRKDLQYSDLVNQISHNESKYYYTPDIDFSISLSNQNISEEEIFRLLSDSGWTYEGNEWFFENDRLSACQLFQSSGGDFFLTSRFSRHTDIIFTTNNNGYGPGRGTSVVIDKKHNAKIIGLPTFQNQRFIFSPEDFILYQNFSKQTSVIAGGTKLIAYTIMNEGEIGNRAILEEFQKAWSNYLLELGLVFSSFEGMELDLDKDVTFDNVQKQLKPLLELLLELIRIDQVNSDRCRELAKEVFGIDLSKGAKSFAINVINALTNNRPEKLLALNMKTEKEEYQDVVTVIDRLIQFELYKDLFPNGLNPRYLKDKRKNQLRAQLSAEQDEIVATYTPTYPQSENTNFSAVDIASYTCTTSIGDTLTVVAESGVSISDTSYLYRCYLPPHNTHYSGLYCTNNGILAYIDSEGLTHICPDTEVNVQTLKGAGYIRETMPVPFSNKVKIPF